MSTTEDRRFEVLRAIVADYVETHEPVGSKALVDRHQLGVSSATVRNDMAVLEAEGYITQQHTSSGRIPTEKGYRQFVDRIAQIKPLSSAERRAILQFLETGVDLDDVLQRSVRLLAQLTRQVAVIQYPVISSARVRHLEVVALAPSRLLLVVILDSGRVEQRLVELGGPVSDEDLSRLRELFGAAVHGKLIPDASMGVADLAPLAPRDLRDAVIRVSTVLVETLVERADDRLVLGGTANLTRNAADFDAVSGSLRSVLETLEEQVVVLKLLTARQQPGTVSVAIGSETQDENLRGASVISTGYGAPGAIFGGVGVLGPTRMDYPGTIASVAAVARYVGEVLGERGCSSAHDSRRGDQREWSESPLWWNHGLSAVRAGPLIVVHTLEGFAAVARDYYRILGVDSKASDQEIKRAYRKLARELHPDVNPDEAAQEKFRDVSDAYEVLSDPEKRRVVDMGGDPLDSAPGGGGFGGGGFSGFGGGGLGDVFEAFFGGGMGGGGRGPRGRVREGNDALIRMELDLDECANGVSRELTVDTAILCDKCQGAGTEGDSKPSTCPTCHGQGEVQSVQRSFLGQVMTSRPCPTCSGVGEVIENPCSKCSGDGRVRTRRNLTVKIPAGVGDGMRVRLAGQGEVGPGGGPAGDLYVEVTESEHEYLTRDGSTLHVTARVPMFDAALGAEVTVPTVIDGELTVEVPPGTQTGDTTVLRGHGMPQVNSQVRGNLVVHFDVAIPSRLDKKQTEKLRELKALFPGEGPHAARRGGQDQGGGIFSRLRDTFAGR